MSCLQVVDCVKEKAGGGLSEAYRFRREQVAVDCLKQLLRRGALGFSVCCFGYFLNRFSVFVPKNYGFLVWCSLRSVDFPFFSIWFSVKCGFRISSFGSGFFSICSIVVRLH